MFKRFAWAVAAAFAVLSLSACGHHSHYYGGYPAHYMGNSAGYVPVSRARTVVVHHYYHSSPSFRTYRSGGFRRR